MSHVSHGDEDWHCLRAADPISLETLTMLLLRNGSCKRQNTASLKVSFHFLYNLYFLLFQFLQGVSCRRTETCLVPPCPIPSSDSGVKKTLPGCEQRNWMSSRKTTRRSGHDIVHCERFISAFLSTNVIHLNILHYLINRLWRVLWSLCC